MAGVRVASGAPSMSTTALEGRQLPLSMATAPVPVPAPAPPAPAPHLVYDDGWARLYWGDCLRVLPLLAAAGETFDLLVTDPPYGVKWESGFRHATFGPIEGDGSQVVALAALKIAAPLLKESRHLYVFGRFAFDGLPLTSPVELIWDKGQLGGGDLSQPWGPSHEVIQFLTRVKSKANRERGMGSLSARLRKGSVLHYPRPNSGAVRHPTEKPVPLLREFIESSSRMGELVLDPFAGIGSTLVAAKLEGRRSVGIELEWRWCEIAIERLLATPAPVEAL